MLPLASTAIAPPPEDASPTTPPTLIVSRYAPVVALYLMTKKFVLASLINTNKLLLEADSSTASANGVTAVGEMTGATN
jgi:hypothetical protein